MDAIADNLQDPNIIRSISNAADRVPTSADLPVYGFPATGSDASILTPAVPAVFDVRVQIKINICVIAPKCNGPNRALPTRTLGTGGADEHDPIPATTAPPRPPTRVRRLFRNTEPDPSDVSRHSNWRFFAKTLRYVRGGKTRVLNRYS